MTPRHVIAHRGASGYRPEHTMASYLLAIEQGASAIEPDLVFSKDGVLVIRHENEISGTTDVALREEFAERLTTKVVDGEKLTGWFTEDFTWAELATLNCLERLPEVRPANAASEYVAPMLRFIDLLDLIERSDAALSVVVEIKHPSYFAELGFSFVDAIARDIFLVGWHSQDPRLIIECFEKSIVVAMKEAGIGAQHFYIMDTDHTAFDEIEWARSQGVPSIGNNEELSEAGLEVFGQKLSGLSLAWSLLIGRDAANVERGKRLVALAHERGLQVFIWTLRPENEFLPENFRQGISPADYGDWEGFFSLLWSLGVDGVFSDTPDLAVGSRP